MHQKKRKKGVILIIIIDLKARRLILGLKQAEIASEIGISYQQYQKYEYGQIKPNINRFLHICKLLKIEKSVIIESLMVDYGIINLEEIKRIITYFENKN